MNGSPSTGVGCVYTDLILLGYDLLFDSLLSLFLYILLALSINVG